MLTNCPALTSVHIPGTLKSASGSIFDLCPELDSFTFSPELTALPAYLFCDCSSITHIEIPDTVTRIGEYAFGYCRNLSTVAFGKGLREIGPNAFYGSGIVSANLPEGLTTLRYRAFYNCPALTSVHIPSTLEIVYGNYVDFYYEYKVFSECPKLDSFTFGQGITTIPNHLFDSCDSMTHIEIPDTVTSIGDYAFRNCKQLQTVDFNPTHPTKIGDFAFRETGITYARLPEGVVELGKGVFYDCPSLTGAYIPSTLKEVGIYFKTNGGCDYETFGKCPNFNNVTFAEGLTAIPRYLCYACTGLTHIEFPESVTSIGEFAFTDCKNLTEVTIPKYVTTIMHNAFSSCEQLQTVNFNTAYLTTISVDAFAGTGITYAWLPEGLVELGVGAFCDCPSLTGAYIPSTLEKANCAFGNCPNFNNVIFGKGITAIPEGLFSACSWLTHIEIPETVTSIGANAFLNCGSLTEVTIPEHVTAIMDGVFNGCYYLSHIEMPEGVTSIGTSAFSGCPALKDISWLPYTVTYIDTGAFNGCTGLVDAMIPDYVTSLGSGAFKNCSKLQTVTTGAGLLTIGDSCFQGCNELSTLHLNEGLTEIASNAFRGCEALTDLVIPDTVTKMGTYCFRECNGLKSVKLSKGLTEIPQYAFANCNQLTEIVIPKGVKTIGAYAFYEDAELRTVEIPQSVTSIGNYAFSDVYLITVRGVEGSYAQTQKTFKWKEFIDIGCPAQSVTFAGGESELVIQGDLTYTPKFEFGPEECTDVVTDMKYDSTDVIVDTENMTLFGTREGEANITVTTSSGKTFTLKVTVTGPIFGIEIAKLPNKVSYKLREEKDMSGLEVYAVYDDGSRQRVYDYTVSHFTTDTIGTRTVTVTYSGKTASFPVTVIDEEGNGSMGSAQELKWHVDQSTKTVTVNGSVEQTDKVIAVAYGENGRMLSTYALDVGGEGVTVDNEYAQLNILWLDGASNPKCENSVITFDA